MIYAFFLFDLVTSTLLMAKIFHKFFVYNGEENDLKLTVCVKHKNISITLLLQSDGHFLKYYKVNNAFR